MGRRLLRYVLIGLGLALLGGLWAFSFFFFNPFEGGYGGPIASLIPREIDFYASKNQLRRDFDTFPRFAFMDELEASPSGQALLDLGVREQVASWKIDEALAELERLLESLPVRIDPLALFGGEGLAVAGHFAGKNVAEAKWALYGRTSWLGKLVVELVSGEFVDLSAQGLSVEPVEVEGERLGVRLSGGQLAVPLVIGRVQDVVLIANDPALLSAAEALRKTRGQDSFLQSAKYADNIGLAGGDGDELELYLDQRSLAEKLGLPGTWPDPTSPDVAAALGAKLFQLGTVRELIGTVDFARVVSFDVTGELSSNVLNPFQTRLYEERGFNKEQMLEVARLVPADAGLFAYLHGDVGDLLREIRSAFMTLDPAAISNLEDFVRAAWNYPDLDPLIDDIDTAVRDRAAFFVRDYDYPAEVGERVPPHDDAPVYTWALILWVEEQAKIDAIRAVITRPDVMQMLRIQGENGQAGLWENTWQGGAKGYEYWNVLVPGTGHIATMEMKGRESYFVITNENRLLGQVFRIYTTGSTDEGMKRLAEDTAFLTWVHGGLPSANLMAWFAPRTLAPTTRRIAARNATQSGADFIDWSVERPRIEREVLAKHFPGVNGNGVPDDQRDSFEQLVQQEVDRFQATYLEQHLPELRASAEREIAASQALSSAFLEIASDRKRLRLQARVGFDLGTEP